jgi:hypothetical protein
MKDPDPLRIPRPGRLRAIMTGMNSFPAYWSNSALDLSKMMVRGR